MALRKRMLSCYYVLRPYLTVYWGEAYLTKYIHPPGYCIPIDTGRKLNVHKTFRRKFRGPLQKIK